MIRSMGITHFDDAPRFDVEVGHLRAAWTFLGQAAETVGVGVRRFQVPPGGWTTPAHEHGREEEIFYVLAGRGHSWHAGRTTEIRAGDCIVYLPHRGAHTIHAEDELDVLAFGTSFTDEAPWFPRLGITLVGRHGVETLEPPADRTPIQFAREAELGPPELTPSDGPRPVNVVNIDDVEPERMERGQVVRTRRKVSAAAGSVTTGLQHVVAAPGKQSAPQHCHSAEEEIFVVLDGGGELLLGDEEIPVHPGHVIARPPGTGVAHTFRGGPGGLTYLAYGTREPNDFCYYPRSNKISFRGLGVIARLERLDYWDGED
jgi:uncharacterized cupin superfamily protein